MLRKFLLFSGFALGVGFSSGYLSGRLSGENIAQVCSSVEGVFQKGECIVQYPGENIIIYVPVTQDSCRIIVSLKDSHNLNDSLVENSCAKAIIKSIQIRTEALTQSSKL